MANITVPSGQMIGFGANKTADTIDSSTGAVTSKGTATADNGSNYILDIAKTKELYFHGERIGLTDNEAKYLRIKTQAWVAENLKTTVATEQTAYNNRLTGSVTFIPTSSFLYSISQTHTITVKVAWDGKVNENVDIAVKAYQYTGNVASSTTEMTGVTITPSGAPSGAAGEEGFLTFTFKATGAKSSVCYKATATYAPEDTQASDGTTLKATRTFSSQVGASSYMQIYYLVSPKETLVASDLTSLTPTTKSTTIVGNHLVTFTDSEGYYFVVAQVGVTLGNLKDKGSDGYYHAYEGKSEVPFIKQSSTVSVNGVAHNVYRIAAQQSASTHTFTF
jgi:hypothetical protein